MALVKNVQGSSDDNAPAGYSSWKDYWETNMHKKFADCSRITCTKPAEVGGHVERVNGSRACYIVPLCSECNSYANVEPFEVRDTDMLLVR